MEDETLRLLLIHADKFEYESKEKAVKEPETLADHAKKGVLQDGLVVFTTVEKGDEASPENTASNAAASIEEVLGWLKTNRVMIYPYAHLSNDLAGREPAIATLKILQSKLLEKGYEVSRAPFGWYKSFTISAKGHPLSELSRTVTSQQQTRQVSAPIKSEYMVMDEKGELHSPETFQYGPGMKEFESLVEKEALKKGLTGGEPRYLEYARRFGLEWSSDESAFQSSTFEGPTCSTSMSGRSRNISSSSAQEPTSSTLTSEPSYSGTRPVSSNSLW